MRTEQEKTATKLRKALERQAHRDRVFKEYPPAVRYAPAHFKKGKKRSPTKRAQPKLGIQ